MSTRQFFAPSQSQLQDVHDPHEVSEANPQLAAAVLTVLVGVLMVLGAAMLAGAVL